MVDDTHLIAEVFQSVRQGQLRADGIAVRTCVRDKQETIPRPDSVDDSLKLWNHRLWLLGGDGLRVVGFNRSLGGDLLEDLRDPVLPFG